MPSAGPKLALCAVVVAIAAASTGDVQASCGDYLASHTADQQMSGRRHAPQYTESAEDAALFGADTVPQRQPCHGPNCHRRSQFPEPAAPFSIERISAEQYCLPTDVTASWSPSPCEFVAISAPLLPHGYRNRVERPPRSLFVVL